MPISCFSLILTQFSPSAFPGTWLSFSSFVNHSLSHIRAFSCLFLCLYTFWYLAAEICIPEDSLHCLSHGAMSLFFNFLKNKFNEKFKEWKHFLEMLIKTKTANLKFIRYMLSFIATDTQNGQWLLNATNWSSLLNETGTDPSCWSQDSNTYLTGSNLSLSGSSCRWITEQYLNALMAPFFTEKRTTTFLA